MTFSAEEVRPVASYMRNVGKNQAADMLEAMTDMHREAFEKWFSVTRPYTNLRAYGGAKWAVEKKSATWQGFQAAMRYRDEQEKQA